MADTGYEAVRYWLEQHIDAHVPASPPQDLCTHVANCAYCRGALVALMAHALHVLPPDADIPCATCEEDLSAYIDRERQQGVEAAFRHYPHIWWHLWVCADCAETYYLTQALLDAEEAHNLTPLPLALMPQRQHEPLASQYPIVQLSRAFLYRVFEAQLALGTAWGDGDDEMLIAEEQTAEYQISLHVQQQGGMHWTVSVSISPPIIGWARLYFGELTFRAPFDAQGNAILTAIPQVLLTNREGPDMIVTIETDDIAS